MVLKPHWPQCCRTANSALAAGKQRTAFLHANRCGNSRPSSGRDGDRRAALSSGFFDCEERQVRVDSITNIGVTLRVTADAVDEMRNFAVKRMVADRSAVWCDSRECRPIGCADQR